jgi:hypothetical protein
MSVVSCPVLLDRHTESWRFVSVVGVWRNCVPHIVAACCAPTAVAKNNIVIQSFLMVSLSP